MEMSWNHATLLMKDKSCRNALSFTFVGRTLPLSDFKTEAALRNELGVAGVKDSDDVKGDSLKLKAHGLCLAFGALKANAGG
jgi:hypothetical protein